MDSPAGAGTATAVFKADAVTRCRFFLDTRNCVTGHSQTEFGN
jgi:hypothetical protein